MNTTLLKIVRRIAVPSTSRNAVEPTSGNFRHYVWFDTGVRRKNAYTPKLMLGVEYDAQPVPMPADGGTVAAGRWTTTKPTGRKRLAWD